MTAENMPAPTPYDNVNALLLFMLEHLQSVLGPQLLGFYLYGSLSLGDFDPASSDVDFLVVTAEEIAEETFERLREMHMRIASSDLPYARKLEGSYIPRSALRRYDPANAYHPTIGVDWPFQRRQHGKNWLIERHIIREHGVIVWGPPPRTLIEPVSPAELRAAVYDQLQSFWRAQLDGPQWLRPRDYQAFAILTLCRALYTLRKGAVCSKPQAAVWAEVAYPQWRPIIERALAWRTQHEEDDLTETLAFLREALAKAEHIQQEGNLAL